MADKSIGVIVLGMHRSGTSLITSLFAGLGCAMGFELNPPFPDNPRGYWEHPGVHQEHESFLNRLGRHWYDRRPLAREDFLGAAATSAKENLNRILLEELLPHPIWVLKDPRMCRLLPLWADLLRQERLEARFVVVLRSPAAVATSLWERDRMSINRAHLLWLRHVLEGELHTRGQARVWISFDELSGSPVAVFESLCHRLGLGATLPLEQVPSVVDTEFDLDLVHHRSDSVGQAGSVGSDTWVQRAFETALSLIPDESREALNRLDTLRRELAEADRLMGPAERVTISGPGRRPRPWADGGVQIFTVSAPNYLDKVRTLARSAQKYCPGLPLHWVVADRPHHSIVRSVASEPFDSVVFATDLPGFSDPAWLFRHSVVELSTAVKARAALYFFEQRDCEALLYFDPDIALFSELPEVLAAIRQHSVVLTPHLLRPEVDLNGVVHHEQRVLAQGLFNLGFLGLRNDAETRKFLIWWNNRCRELCPEDFRGGLFTDQKWVDFAPIFFENVEMLKNPRFNVAPWNINQRDVSGDVNAGFSVDGEPLGFYHFSGFADGSLRSFVQGWSPENRSLRDLLDWYEKETSSARPEKPIPWNLGRYDNGAPIESFHRKLYHARPDVRDAFPNPYAVTAGWSFLHWLTVQAPGEHPEFFPPRRPWWKGLAKKLLGPRGDG